MSGTPQFEISEREPLLDYQQHLAETRPWLHRSFRAAHRGADRRLIRQIQQRWAR